MCRPVKPSLGFVDESFVMLKQERVFTRLLPQAAGLSDPKNYFQFLISPLAVIRPNITLQVYVTILKTLECRVSELIRGYPHFYDGCLQKFKDSGMISNSWLEMSRK